MSSDKPAYRRIIGIDGEGQDTPDGRHIYTYLAAVDEKRRPVAQVYDPKGLSHEDCARMILSLPQSALKFGYAFNYDVTKIIEDLPLADRYYLLRPQLRRARQCAKCRYVLPTWKDACPCGNQKIRDVTKPVSYGTRLYDYFNGSLTIKQLRRGKRPIKIKIWDCFRFFGCSFVEALKDWGVGTPDEIERIAGMKGKRGAFDKEDPAQIKAYCQEECWLLARMMRKVIDAHDAADIPLKRFDGAGSTATSLLRRSAVGSLGPDVSKYKGPPHKVLDPALGKAIATAFFGGRFEGSTVGVIERPVHGFDISSAYPFALSSLPCLSCGEWKRVSGMTYEGLAGSRLVLAAYRIRQVSTPVRRELAWCPLPCRTPNGSIVYGTNFRGWAWSPELRAAMRGWPELVELTGDAWIYETTCTHKPFAFLPSVYRKRIEWGKEGAGKVLKLGTNASYGKTAQSKGDDPPFQSWVWAGMTTSITRSQILDAIASAQDRWSVLSIATDGIAATEKLDLKVPPWDTGTGDLAKPLGGWERKEIEEGLFVAKPGLYYRLRPTLADIRARGVGRREVSNDYLTLMLGFLEWDRRDPDYHVPLISRRFYGAKHSITAHSKCAPCKESWPGVPEQLCPSCDEPGTSFKTSLTLNEEQKVAYGTWSKRTVRIAFDPFPKRERETVSRAGRFARLRIRDLEGIESKPYDVGSGTTSPEGQASRDAKEFMLEQPDWDRPDLAFNADPDFA